MAHSGAFRAQNHSSRSQWDSHSTLLYRILPKLVCERGAEGRLSMWANGIWTGSLANNMTHFIQNSVESKLEKSTSMEARHQSPDLSPSGPARKRYSAVMAGGVCPMFTASGLAELERRRFSLALKYLAGPVHSSPPVSLHTGTLNLGVDGVLCL